MPAKAWATGRGRNNRARLDKDFRKPFLDTLEINLLRRRDYNGAHPGRDMPSLHNIRRNAYILNASVGARADHALLDFNMADFVRRFGIFRQMRASDGRTERG